MPSFSFWGTSMLFPKYGCANSHSHQQDVSVPLSPQPCWPLLLLIFLTIATLIRESGVSLSVQCSAFSLFWLFLFLFLSRPCNCSSKQVWPLHWRPGDTEAAFLTMLSMTLIPEAEVQSRTCRAYEQEPPRLDSPGFDLDFPVKWCDSHSIFLFTEAHIQI